MLQQTCEVGRNLTAHKVACGLSSALLTGGGDRPYALGLASALLSRGVALDFIGSDDLDSPDLRASACLNFLNLRGNQRSDVRLHKKIARILVYYVRLLRYASTAKPKIFHLLWNNKFQIFDRTVLMMYYKHLGKKICLTVHNVNAGRRDSKDSYLNRLTLRIQYRLADHLFVHTEQMKAELIEEFGVQETRLTVIPFGINNTVPNTSLSPRDARQRLSIRDGDKTVLFFGNIAPYKGLDYLTTAFQLLPRSGHYRLIIAGRPKEGETYWRQIQDAIQEDTQRGRVLVRADYIPDEETEVFFKAADVVILPYTHIFQSGVLFLAYSFGVPVIATDVGSLKDDIVEGKTGFLCRPKDPTALAGAIESYFSSDLFKDLGTRRLEIRNFANERHSWDIVVDTTVKVYESLRKEIGS